MNKSISTKAALKLNNTKFTIKNCTTIGERNPETNQFSYIPKVFKTHASTGYNNKVSVSISEDSIFSRGMNVDRFGSSKISLFTFTPFGKKVTETIRYSDITILEIGQEVVNDLVTLER